ncbi:MAG: hypothetical protein ISS15_18360 [Alphaproteobacteria bacterium]|nr:hypothetical protein [Alphaproteobacteria bacterium]MBL7099627.1 hypothetical protein [Alphaproteobacteria bacterium]
MAAKKKAKKAKKAPARKAKRKLAKAARRAPAKKKAAKRVTKSAKKAPKRASAKKTPAKKAVKKTAVKSSRSASKEFGEGNYKAAHRFGKAQESFVHAHKSDIPAMGHKAEAALEGPEGKELAAAEEEAKGHAAGEEP